MPGRGENAIFLAIVRCRLFFKYVAVKGCEIPPERYILIEAEIESDSVKPQNLIC